MNSNAFICGSSGCEEHSLVPEKQQHALSQKTSSVLKNAIEEEIRTILEKGVSIPVLLELARFANTAQELMMIRNPSADVRTRRRRGPFASGITPMSAGSYQYTAGYDDSEYGPPLTTEAAGNETFGAKLSRELVSAVGAMRRSDKPTVPDLIESIKQAKEAGLDNVVTQLEGSLSKLLSEAEGDEQAALPAAESDPQKSQVMQ